MMGKCWAQSVSFVFPGIFPLRVLRDVSLYIFQIVPFYAMKEKCQEIRKTQQTTDDIKDAQKNTYNQQGLKDGRCNMR